MGNNASSAGLNLMMSESRSDIGPSQKLVAADSFICEHASRSELVSLLTQHPHDPFLHLWLGLISWNQGDYVSAEQEFIIADRQGAPSWRTSWYRALLVRDDKKRWGWRRYDYAKTLVASVLKHRPDFKPALVYQTYLEGYYSQLGQDVLTEDFFSINCPREFRFVDVGAYDGVHLSNSRRLYERGWKGICIEPLQEKHAALHELYEGSDVICLQNAVALNEGMAHITLEGTGSSLVQQGESSKKTQPVKVRKLASILSEYSSTGVDFLSIDAEGFDFEVLASLDFDTTQPQLIVVETNSVQEVMLPIQELMAAKGYIQWHDNVQDLFFRSPQTVAAPNFWELKTLLPHRHAYEGAQLAPANSATSSVTDAAGSLALLKSLKVLLQQNSYHRAHRLTVDALNNGCCIPSLSSLKIHLESALSSS